LYGFWELFTQLRSPRFSLTGNWGTTFILNSVPRRLSSLRFISCRLRRRMRWVLSRIPSRLLFDIRRRRFGL
jgi:hypothetical protein